MIDGFLRRTFYPVARSQDDWYAMMAATVFVIVRVAADDSSVNQLTSLPEALALLPHLQEIDARNNPLVDIPQALRQKEGLTLLVDE